MKPNTLLMTSLAFLFMAGVSFAQDNTTKTDQDQVVAPGTDNMTTGSITTPRKTFIDASGVCFDEGQTIAAKDQEECRRLSEKNNAGPTTTGTPTETPAAN